MTSDKDSNCIKELVSRYFKQFNELISYLRSKTLVVTVSVAIIVVVSLEPWKYNTRNKYLFLSVKGLLYI